MWKTIFFIRLELNSFWLAQLFFNFFRSPYFKRDSHELIRGGSIRPNPEGRIIENQKAKFFWPLGQNRKAEFDSKAENQSTLISAQYINIFLL